MQSDWYNCLDWWTILSTDDSVCEYTKNEHGNMVPSCNPDWVAYYNDAWQVCPYCTRPIKVITETEVPATLSIAGIPISITYNTPDNAVKWGFATRQDAEKAARTIVSLLRMMIISPFDSLIP